MSGAETRLEAVMRENAQEIERRAAATAPSTTSFGLILTCRMALRA